MKKFKMASLLGVLLISVLTFVVNVQGNPFSVYGALALTNVEALANGEGATGVPTGEYVSYDFNGQYWHGVAGSGSGNWYPYYDTCRIDGKNGHQIRCLTGSGNCWNGTSCVH